jgi:hypothetical protein
MVLKAVHLAYGLEKKGAKLKGMNTGIEGHDK